MNKDELIEYADYLLKTAVNKVSSIDDAQEIVQETMLAALAAIENKTDIDNPKSWLLSVLNRKFYDNLRRKYRKPVISIAVADEIPDCTVIHDHIEKSEDSENIRCCIAYLSKLYREVMVRFYMKGESVKQIARSLDISENTVKTRLGTGREHIRKEFGMKNYTNQSFDPEYLWMSCSGIMGQNKEPFSLVPRDDRIAMNLLILAYEKPVTVSELSKAIGIASAYAEPVIDRLVNGGLMARTSNKVYTDFIIYNSCDRMITRKLEEKYAQKYYADIWCVLENGFAELAETDYFMGQNERQRTKMQAYFAVRTLEHSLRCVRNEFTGELDTNFDDYYPDRSDGGKWFAMANRVSEREKLCWGNGYAVNGEYSISYNNISVYEYNTCLNSECRIYALDEDVDYSPMFYLAFKQKYDSIDLINPKTLSYTDKLISLGYFTRADGRLTVDIPIITANQRYELYNLSSKHAELIAQKYHDMYADIFRDKAVKIPVHLKSVPEFLRYLWCGNSLSMMIIMKAKEEGLFLNGVDYSIPTAYMTVSKDN